MKARSVVTRPHLHATNSDENCGAGIPGAAMSSSRSKSSMMLVRFSVTGRSRMVIPVKGTTKRGEKWLDCFRGKAAVAYHLGGQLAVDLYDSGAIIWGDEAQEGLKEMSSDHNDDRRWYCLLRRWYLWMRTESFIHNRSRGTNNTL